MEPVPSVFRRLKSNYENDSRFIFENVAITDDDGFRSFYSVSETAKQSLPELPAWLDHLSSFDKELILKFDR